MDFPGDQGPDNLWTRWRSGLGMVVHLFWQILA